MLSQLLQLTARVSLFCGEKFHFPRRPKISLRADFQNSAIPFATAIISDLSVIYKKHYMIEKSRQKQINVDVQFSVL